MGSTAPTLKRLMKTQAAPIILTYQSSKCKATQGVTQKTITRKRLRRTRPSTAQVKQFILFSKWYSISNSDSFLTVINHCIPICSGCWTVVPGVWISTTRPSSADLPKELITIETTDASKTVEMRILPLHLLMLPRYLLKILDFSFNFHLSLSISPY